MSYQLTCNEEPTVQTELTGNELNMIEVALLELYDNVQYENDLDGDERHNRMQTIHGILVKLGDM